MKNLEQFSAKVQYVTPSCKSAVLEPRASMLNATSDNGWGDYGRAGQSGGVDEDEI